jgi:hypothetical protein
MLSRIALALCLGVLWSCGGSSSPASDPGPLVDNTQWVPSNDGSEIFGSRPEGSACERMPSDCPNFPWPEGECVTFEEGSTCIASYVPECFPPAYTVLAVYTRMPDDDRIALCDWLTLEQPSLRAIRAGDKVEVRAYHAELTAPAPDGEARMSFVIGDELIFDERIPIPFGSEFLSEVWTAPKEYPAGTQLLWHVDNHGSNEYLLIEVNILDALEGP